MYFLSPHLYSTWMQASWEQGFLNIGPLLFHHDLDKVWRWYPLNKYFIQWLGEPVIGPVIMLDAFFFFFLHLKLHQL